MANFFKKAFQDMKESAKAQHEVDKANLEAVKAESKAQWEEAKMSPAARQAKMQAERKAQIAKQRQERQRHKNVSTQRKTVNKTMCLKCAKKKTAARISDDCLFIQGTFNSLFFPRRVFRWRPNRARCKCVKKYPRQAYSAL